MGFLSINKKLIASKLSDQQHNFREIPVRVVLPFSKQPTPLRNNSKKLSSVTGKPIELVFISQRIGQIIKRRERKPKIVNQQCVVYYYKCDLCDADYVGYTRRHLHQRIVKHRSKSSVADKHFIERHDTNTNNLPNSSLVLRKCRNKFDCLIYEMFSIRKLKPCLNSQSDSIHAKLFT